MASTFTTSPTTAIPEETTSPTSSPLTTSPTLHIKKCPSTEIEGLYFPETNAGSWTTPAQLCLNSDYTPVRIFCQKNATWDFKDLKNCSSEVKITKTTQKLYDVLNTSSASLNEVNDLVKNEATYLDTIDIYLISKILSDASQNEDIVKQPETFVGIINDLLDTSKEKLSSSQELLNSTDTILYSLDQVILNNGSISLKNEKLFIETIVSAKTTGVMVTNSKSGPDFTSFSTEYLDQSSYEEKLSGTDFEIAILVPREITNNSNYFITLFYNDHLFSQKDKAVGSWILSILIPDYVGKLSIKIYYKQVNFANDLTQECQHWKYGIEENTAIFGSWSLDSNATKLKEGFYECVINHTTHFGMLVSGSIPESDILDLITIFGSVFSLIAIAVIFTTALVFKKWRDKANSKIVLNVSFCLLLLIILFIICDKIEQGPFCIIIGILLHYTILANFCWASAISHSSYRRFYKVFSDHIEHAVLKFCLFSWGVPVIIVIIVASIEIQTYNKTTNQEMCYPKGIYLTLGVCLPLAIILAMNSTVYVLIAKNLLTTRFDAQKHVIKKSCAVQKSIGMLFFMMGINWIFGFLVAFTDNVVFVYLFCTTATLHGFAIFLFFVLDSSEVGQLWKQLIKYKTLRRERVRESTTVDGISMYN